MLFLKTNPTGIDFYIQQLQSQLHSTLVAKWALADNTQYQCYGRCYRNKTKDGYIAENYVSDKEYKEVYWNDALTAISFFGVTGSVKKGVMNEAGVHLVMFADLSKLSLKDYKGVTIVHRADEELRQMVQNIIGGGAFGFLLDSIDLWVENVLKEYPGSRRDDRLKFVDMHPVHCFRLNLKLNYNPNKNC